MSQSRNISRSFGSIVLNDAPLKSSSTSQVAISAAPAASSLTVSATTVTAAQVLTGLLTQSPSSALTVTLPTSAAFLASLPGSAVGDSFVFTYINLNGTNAATIAVDSGTGTLVGAAGVALSTSARFQFRFTSVTGSGTYTVYRL